MNKKVFPTVVHTCLRVRTVEAKDTQQTNVQKLNTQKLLFQNWKVRGIVHSKA